jgi:hypothetical protein
MKAKMFFVLSVVLVASWSLLGQAKHPISAPSEYEFKVMPLIALVGDSPEAAKKISEMMVKTKDGFNRTDLDVTDYQAAFDRLAKDGWEPVTVNKSNYWVFRRLKRQG